MACWQSLDHPRPENRKNAGKNNLNKYIAFLRAINVGGHRIIKMTDLKRIFQSLGFENVDTYIQSGNVIFESKEDNISLLEGKTETQLQKILGYNVEVFLRTIGEIVTIASQSPFKPKGDETVHITFLSKKPGKKLQQSLMSFQSEADDFAIKDRVLYNLRRDRNKSVFSNNFVERILGVPATTRNLTTINKIIEKYG